MVCENEPEDLIGKEEYDKFVEEEENKWTYNDLNKNNNIERQWDQNFFLGISGALNKFFADYGYYFFIYISVFVL